VPLEPPDQQHWQAAAGYVELGMFLEADTELDKIDPFNRAAPEVLAMVMDEGSLLLSVDLSRKPTQLSVAGKTITVIEADNARLLYVLSE
jgi:hypothetical protein